MSRKNIQSLNHHDAYISSLLDSHGYICSLLGCYEEGGTLQDDHMGIQDDHIPIQDDYLSSILGSYDEEEAFKVRYYNYNPYLDWSPIITLGFMPIGICINCDAEMEDIPHNYGNTNYCYLCPKCGMAKYRNDLWFDHLSGDMISGEMLRNKLRSTRILHHKITDYNAKTIYIADYLRMLENRDMVEELTRLYNDKFPPIMTPQSEKWGGIML